MSQISIHPMQWAKVEDLHNVAPLCDKDIECMKEVREVLRRHDKLDRFALHLIHKHFDLADDEILMEYSDPSIREQYFRPEKVENEISVQAIPTTWTLREIEPLAACKCAYRMSQGHLGRHETA